MLPIDDLDYLISEAGALGKWNWNYGRRPQPTIPLDIGGGLTTPASPEEPTLPSDEIAPFPLDKRRPNDENTIYGIPRYRWKYMTPEEQQAAIDRYESQNSLVDKLTSDWMSRQAPPPQPVDPSTIAPPQQLPADAPPGTIAKVNYSGTGSGYTGEVPPKRGEWYVGQGAPKPRIRDTFQGQGGQLVAPAVDLKPVGASERLPEVRPTGAVRKNEKGQWIDARGNVLAAKVTNFPERVPVYKKVPEFDEFGDPTGKKIDVDTGLAKYENNFVDAQGNKATDDLTYYVDDNGNMVMNKGNRLAAGEWADEQGKVMPYTAPERLPALNKPLSPEQRAYQNALQERQNAIEAAWDRYEAVRDPIVKANRQRRNANTKLRKQMAKFGTVLTDAQFEQLVEQGAAGFQQMEWEPEVNTLDDLVTMGYADSIPPEPPKPAPKATRLKRSGSSSSPTALTADGPARMINFDPENKDLGFIIFDDRNDDIPLAGPFSTEVEANTARNAVAVAVTKDEIRRREEEEGPLNDVQKQAIRNNVEDHISYRLNRQRADEAAPSKWEHGGTEWQKSDAGGVERRYEYGGMRQKQLQMWQSGRDEEGNVIDPSQLKIEQVSDDNPEGYMDGKLTADHLKKIFCPLILDKADPPKQPWTFDQVMKAMWPLMQVEMNRWIGGGFTESDAAAVAGQALMKAIINDKGKSNFTYYAMGWVRGDLLRAKKTGSEGGVMRSSSRGEGWMNRGVGSLNSAVAGAEGGAEGEVGDYVDASAPSFDKVKCPECEGNGIDIKHPLGECEYCQGKKVLPPTKKHPNGRKCIYCKGRGQNYDKCNVCGGTGKWVVVNPKEYGSLTRHDKSGRLVDDAAISRDKEKGKTGSTQEILDSGNVDIERDASGRVSDVHGNISPADKAEMMERLNKANQFIVRLMDKTPMTNNQRAMIGFRFGLPVPGMRDGYGPPMTSTEVTEVMAMVANSKNFNRVMEILEGIKTNSHESWVPDKMIEVINLLRHHKYGEVRAELTEVAKKTTEKATKDAVSQIMTGEKNQDGIVTSLIVAPTSATNIDIKVKDILNKLRNTMADTKDRELFDWYEEFVNPEKRRGNRDPHAPRIRDIWDYDNYGNFAGWGSQERQMAGLQPLEGAADAYDDIERAVENAKRSGKFGPPGKIDKKLENEFRKRLENAAVTDTKTPWFKRLANPSMEPMPQTGYYTDPKTNMPRKLNVPERHIEPEPEVVDPDDTGIDVHGNTRYVRGTSIVPERPELLRRPRPKPDAFTPTPVAKQRKFLDQLSNDREAEREAARNRNAEALAARKAARLAAQEAQDDALADELRAARRAARSDARADYMMDEGLSILNIMEQLHNTLILEEVESGEMGEEVLGLLV